MKNFSEEVRDELCDLFDSALVDLNVVSENDFCVKKPSVELSAAYLSYEKTFNTLRELLRNCSEDCGSVGDFFLFLQLDVNRFLYNLPSYSPLRHYFYKACHIMALCVCGSDLFWGRNNTLQFLKRDYGDRCRFDSNGTLVFLKLSYGDFRDLVIRHFFYSQFLLKGVRRAIDVIFNHGSSVPHIDVDHCLVDVHPLNLKTGDDRVVLTHIPDFGMSAAAKRFKKNHPSTYQTVFKIRERLTDLIQCVGMDPEDDNVLMSIYFQLVNNKML